MEVRGAGGEAAAAWGQAGPRALEFVAVFVVLPLLAAWAGDHARHWILPQVWVLAAIVLVVLWRDPGFDRRRLSLRAALVAKAGAWILVMMGAAVLAVGVLALVLPVRLFDFPQHRPVLWAAVMCLYPLLSALPQELIFRVFLFHRYASLFPDPRWLVGVSAGSFALAHVQLGNPVAPPLALIGGALFAYGYQRSRSLGLPVLVHALLGDWIFSVGLGRYFYGGDA